MKRKAKDLRSAHGCPDEVKRSVQMYRAQNRTGATAYELEYYFQTGKRLPKIKEEGTHE